MKIVAEILDLTTESYSGKRGQVSTPCLTISDRSEGVRCLDNFDMMLREDQSAKLPSHDRLKLQGKKLVVGIAEIKPSPIGGRLRMRGELLEFDGKPI